MGRVIPWRQWKGWETNISVCEPLSPSLTASHLWEENEISSRKSCLSSVSVDERVLDKAKKLSLRPRQEHMRMNITKALVSHKPRLPKSKAKSGPLS